MEKSDEIKKVRLVRDYGCQSILSSSNVPILFVLICFVVIANIRCDQVASTNDDNLDSDKSADNSGSSTYDPFNMFREIYLDQNSKVITMILPTPGQDPVQKFHPNGRYGRRSVNDFTETHSELGKLRHDEDYSGTLKNILKSKLSRVGGVDDNAETNRITFDNELNNNQNNQQQQQQQIRLAFPDPSKMLDLQESSSSTNDDYKLQLNKLLKCNYTGISNLYWCDSS